MAFFKKNQLLLMGVVLMLTFSGCSASEEVAEVKGYEVQVNGETIGYSDSKIDETWIRNNVIDEDIELNVLQVPVMDEVTTLAIDNLLKDIEEKYNTLVLENKTEVVELEIGNKSWIVGSEKEACDVIKTSIETLLDYNIQVEVSIVDGIVQVEYIILDEQPSLKSIEVIEPMTASVEYVDKESVLPIDKAIEEITKKTEKPKMYEVQAGDVPGTIAADYEMSLTSLYEMNPDLEERSEHIQIGEEVVVTVPEPEMTIKTLETIIYDEIIEKGYTYQNDADLYIGSNKTISFGSDGTMEVIAEVEKVDGKEVNRSIVEETVMISPVNAVIATGTKKLPDKGSLGTFVSPLEEFVLTSEFGPRWNSQHRGIDMAANYGTSVRASDGGVVTYAGWWGSYGYLVEIDHGNGFKTRYGHNSKILVAVGQVVSQYEQLALVGSTGNSTGPHVHFEIMIDDIPVDPYLYME